LTADDQQSGGALKRVPVLLPGDVPPEAVLASQDTGLKEAKLLGKNLSSDEIASVQANNEMRRNETFRDHFENVAVCGLWTVAGVVLIVGSVWFWHVIMPEKWHWLSLDGISRLQNILTGGVLASLAGGHMKRRLG